MRCIIIMSLIFFFAPTSNAAESVVVINRTSDMFRTVWLREDGWKRYEQVARALWSNNGTRIYVDRMPFYIALSKRDRSYSFIGPFDRDYLSKRAAKIEVLERHVYETKTREVQFWCRRHQRWETRICEYNVSKPIPFVRLTGLEDALDGASILRESESLDEPEFRELEAPQP